MLSARLAIEKYHFLKLLRLSNIYRHTRMGPDLVQSVHILLFPNWQTRLASPLSHSLRLSQPYPHNAEH